MGAKNRDVFQTTVESWPTNNKSNLARYPARCQAYSLVFPSSFPLWTYSRIRNYSRATLCRAGHDLFSFLAYKSNLLFLSHSFKFSNLPRC